VRGRHYRRHPRRHSQSHLLATGVLSPNISGEVWLESIDFDEICTRIVSKDIFLKAPAAAKSPCLRGRFDLEVDTACGAGTIGDILGARNYFVHNLAAVRSLTLPHTLSLSLSFSLSIYLALSLAHTLSHTHSVSLYVALSLSLSSLSLSPSLSLPTSKRGWFAPSLTKGELTPLLTSEGLSMRKRAHFIGSRGALQGSTHYLIHISKAKLINL